MFRDHIAYIGAAFVLTAGLFSFATAVTEVAEFIIPACLFSVAAVLTVIFAERLSTR